MLQSSFCIKSSLRRACSPVNIVSVQWITYVWKTACLLPSFDLPVKLFGFWICFEATQTEILSVSLSSTAPIYAHQLETSIDRWQTHHVW